MRDRNECAVGGIVPSRLHSLQHRYVSHLPDHALTLSTGITTHKQMTWFEGGEKEAITIHSKDTDHTFQLATGNKTFVCIAAFWANSHNY